MTPLPTRYDLRLLLCPSCGAPIETVPQGGHLQCRYCQAVMELAPRKDRPEDFRTLATVAPAGSDQERFARLRAQLGATDAYSFPPAGLRTLALRATNPSLRPEIERLWREALASALHQPADDTDARLYWCAVLFRSALIQARDYVRARAVVETTSDAIRDPVFLTLLRISLAARACDTGDVQSAEAWLGAVDPKSWLLGIHTDLALVRSRIALLSRDYVTVFTHLGREPDEIPVATADDVLACMLRATAYEGLGDLASARRALWAVGRSFAGKVFGPKKVGLFRQAYPNLPLCTQSYPLFRSAVRVRRVLLGGAVVVVVAVPLVASVVLAIASMS